MKYSSKATKAHQAYHNSSGERLPGVTTIVGQRAKYLEKWVAKIVSEGIDYNRYMDEVAKIGSCAHEMVMAELQGRDPEVGVYTQEQIMWANNAYVKVIEWATRPNVNLTLLESEVQMVSEKMQVGGTMDMYVQLEGVPAVMDMKTSDSAIYLDNMYQVAAYAAMAIESGREVKYCGIIRAAKDPVQNLEIISVGTKTMSFKKLVKGFMHLREMYSDDRALKRDLGVR